MRAVATIFFVVLIASVQPVLAEKRVALVIGNSAYQNVSRLANPGNDSEAMSATLKKAGFDVVDLKRDLTANAMRRALRDFSDYVSDADMAIVYYAGHGIEIDGINYLIPVDAVLERDIDAFDEALPLDRLLTVIEPARQLRLVILDACRDNPFNKNMKRTIGARAIGRGLARVELTSPNTLIAFAAKAGSTASDGDGKYSPFTASLLKYLTRPGLDLRKALGFTRDDVLKTTNNRQEPFVYGSLGGEDLPLVPAPPAAPADSEVATRRAYELALQVGTPEIWDSFIANYPNSFYTDLAKAQRRKLAVAEQAAEQARLAAERKKALEEAKTAEAERAKAVAQAKADEDAKIAAAKAKAADEMKAQDDKPAEQLAALGPPGQAGDTAVKADKPGAEDIPRLLQTELRRVGCNTGAIDRSWTVAAQKSLGLFNKHAGTTFDVKLASLDALNLVRSKPERICPLICTFGYRAEGDRCVKISCGAGFFLNDDNECAKKRETPARENRAVKRNLPKRDQVQSEPSAPSSYDPYDRNRRITMGGFRTCGGNGCQIVPKGCHAIRGMGGGGLGGKIVCP
jgi:uncharacterized caspase-like protein